MRKCPSCKKEVADGIAFCPSCGCKLDKNCSACGNIVLPEDAFCGKCGKSTTPTAMKIPKKAILVFSIILSSLIILSVAGKLLYDHFFATYNIRDEVVIANKSGLMWQKSQAPNMMNYYDAVEYCKDLTLDGYSDWRLPSISELKTLIVGCQSGTDACSLSDKCLTSGCWTEKTCACKDNKGPGEGGYYLQKGVWQGGGNGFWSASVPSDNPDFACHVFFYNGNVYINYRNNEYAARCVRGKKYP